MKALLIGINSKYIHPSLALYQLKKNTTYECDILELTIKDSMESALSKILKYDLNNYELIGCSCYLWNIDNYLALVPKLKEINPSLKFIFGGPEVAYDAKYFLSNFSFIDYILAGEGEVCFEELCEYLDGKRELYEVSNLYYRKNNDVVLTGIIRPDLSKIKLATLDVPDYKNRIVYLESSRGCPYHCSYCTASLDNKVRYFPLEEIFRILKILMDNKTKVVKFLDRTFNANINYMHQILDFINEHNKCTVFQFEVVGETLREETILKIASLKKKWLRFEIGIQSTNEKVNLAVQRKQNMAKLRHNIELLQDTGKVDLHVDLIAGLPYETLNSFISSFNEAFSLRGKELQLGFLKFLRGTLMMDMIEEHDYKYHDKAPYEVISNKYMSVEDFREIHMVEKSLDRYYNDMICPLLFKYLFKENLVDNFYQFFKGLYKDIFGYQKDLLFTILDDYLKDSFKDQYPVLNFIIKADYLNNFKVRPKLWWKNDLISNRDEIFEKVILKNPLLNKETLYRYSTIVQYNNNYFVIIYKDYKPVSYFITL